MLLHSPSSHEVVQSSRRSRPLGSDGCGVLCSWGRCGGCADGDVTSPATAASLALGRYSPAILLRVRLCTAACSPAEAGRTKRACQCALPPSEPEVLHRGIDTPVLRSVRLVLTCVTA